jgi:hypothetical protein
MLRQVLGFLGSTSVAILLTAAGLVFNADQLTYFGGGLLAVVASAWLLLRFNPRPDPEKARVIWTERKDLIANARTLIARHTRGEAGDTPFREFFVGLPVYAQLRRHLSAAYLKDFDNLRLGVASNGAMDAFAAGLIIELDRLESEWELDRA